jgi:hypothetical protein
MPDSGSPTIEALRDVWRGLKYFRRSAFVRTRAELDAALARAPRYVIVEGTEALRAYAASLAYRGGQEAAEMEEAAAVRSATPTYMMVPTVGRIRDGYRQAPPLPDRRRENRGRRARVKLQAGMGAVIAAVGGLFAALLIEFLMWPSSDPELVRGPHRALPPPRRGVEVRLPTHAPAPPPPTFGARIVDVLVPVLSVLAIIALLFLLWQLIGPGRAARISWRVDYRVQGRLVIRRVRTRIA